MVSVYDVANYFLAQSSDEAGDLISNLKLQKLVYYAQGCHLAVFDEPLFDEPIEAWLHGPVSPVLYQKYKSYESSGIPCPDEADFTVFTTKQRELLEEVYSVYGQFSAWKLRNMTHEEAPWKDTPINFTISHGAMKSFFKTCLND
jgi:uncharacterized phage-associated protein